MNLTPKDIVLAAFHYLANITPPTQKISEVRIEEVVPTIDEPNFWKVILSYDNIGDFPFDRSREFKEFKVSDTDGSVVYMKSVDAK